ncbi:MULTISPECIES: sigma-70 family RNA polymerase sigma factor [Actinomadura]|uniref:Sigma-70 family RNA polymerase sigma factor n=1 Tax=Actinomadura yumaensis TaxID=111807 RepID=A0ABW2CIG2_9ACTN|nr:sigma-70 family RNA polymerase sigma factor [Actinomadura sp. J1-007]MWK39849.1 sigma-70 family RNA polymerase sigma factor [Actinomadura sp. J1-007]
MDEQDWVRERFAEHQDRLHAVAYRMLGSPGEAEDAVQEAWLRVSRADTGQVENPGGWLTTIVARVCLNMLEARRIRPEEPAGALPAEPHARHASIRPNGQDGPEDEALLADSVGVALMVVLDALAPAERLAFVLHDVFAVSFAEIGGIIDRSPTAARQIASRARRRVQGAAGASDAARSAKREIIEAFLAASRGGDFAALLELLDPDAVAGDLRGGQEVAAFFAGRAQAARLALVDGVPAAVWSHLGRPKAVITFTVDEKITRIDIDTDPERVRTLDIVVLPADAPTDRRPMEDGPHQAERRSAGPAQPAARSSDAAGNGS